MRQSSEVFYISLKGGIAAVTPSQGWTACGHLAALLLCRTAETLIHLCGIAEPTMRQEKNPNQRAWHFLWSVEAVFAGKFM